MRVKAIFFILFFGFSFFPFLKSQEIYQSSTINDHWFFTFGAGAQIYLGENDSQADFSDRISFLPAVSVGKWLNPFWAVQMKLQGGALHGFENDGSFRQKDKYYNVQLDALWNLSNQITGYSSSRILSVSPYLGLGFAHRFQLKSDSEIPNARGVQSNYRDYSNALSVNGGIQLDIKLSKRISLNFDMGATILPDYFDKIVTKNGYESVITASGGIKFKLGKTDFEQIDIMDPLMIGKLNDEINILRDKNVHLEKALKNKPDCPECPIASPEMAVASDFNFIPNVVFFKLNSANVDENQHISIFNTAKFLKENGTKVKIVGYADKSTGSFSYNLNLSEKRAKAVASLLESKYNIPSEDIEVEWKGSEEQLYEEETWNRIVVMFPLNKN